MQDYWPDSGYRQLTAAQSDRLYPSDAWLRLFLGWPELALVDTSCPAESALHHALMDQPSRPVTPHELAGLTDDDTRANYSMFLELRDDLRRAGSLEDYYLQLMRAGRVAVAPQFVDHIVMAIVRRALGDEANAFEARAGEMLFRPQRITRADGCTLAADLATVDRLSASAGPRDLQRLLAGSGAALTPMDLPVLSPDSASRYFASSGVHGFVLDLTLETVHEAGPGLRFQLGRTHSGLKALARVLERWVAHLLGLRVRITPMQKVDDPAWRWHVGLDAESMALLNDLYLERPVGTDRLHCLISLFRLDFEDLGAMRTDLAGRPVYLGLAMAPDGCLRLKPQNLLLNLPLAAAA